MGFISQNAAAPKLRIMDGADCSKSNSSAFEKSKRKRNRDEQQLKKSEREKEMQRLESVLFASPNSTLVFEEDRSPDTQHLLSREPAWIDEAEERIQVNISKATRLRKLRKDINEHVISGAEYIKRLRAQHMKLNPGTHWARVGSDPVVEEDEDYRDLSTSTSELVESHKQLELLWLGNVNREEESNSKINSIQFHPNGQLMFTAGPGFPLKLFQVDGIRNPKVDSLSLEDDRIYKALFTPDGLQLILAVRKKYFCTYDFEKNHVNRVGPLTGRDEKSLESSEVSPDSKIIAFVGNEGHILLVSSTTKQLIGTLKMNGTLRSLSFAENGTQLLTGGGDGRVYHWDIGTRTCMHVGPDDGSTGVSGLCVSPDSSSSGIVNVYERAKFLNDKKKPFKTVKNLTTEATEMKFAPSAQCFAICTQMKRNGMRLLNVPSFDVVSNWPSHNLGHARCFDFNPNGNFLAMGNTEGNAFIWEMNYGT